MLPKSVLGDVGFLKDDRQTLMPAKFVLRNSEELQIDLHPVTLKPDGSAEHLDFDDTSNFYTFVHSAAGLSGVGMINGRIVRCTTAAEQIRQKVERRYSPWHKQDPCERCFGRPRGHYLFAARVRHF